MYESFVDINATSMLTLPEPSEQLAGEHAMCMVGYDLIGKYFIAKNSFGPYWGDGGYCYIPFEYMKNESYDSWTFDLANQVSQTV